MKTSEEKKAKLTRLIKSYYNKKIEQVYADVISEKNRRLFYQAEVDWSLFELTDVFENVILAQFALNILTVLQEYDDEVLKEIVNKTIIAFEKDYQDMKERHRPLNLFELGTIESQDEVKNKLIAILKKKYLR